MGGNLEDLLQDIQNLSRNIDELQVQNDNNLLKECSNRPDIVATESSSLNATNNNTNDPTMNKKPFRSEVNLVLTYQDGSSAILTQKTDQNEFETIQNQPLPPLPPLTIVQPTAPTIEDHYQTIPGGSTRFMDVIEEILTPMIDDNGVSGGIGGGGGGATTSTGMMIDDQTKANGIITELLSTPLLPPQLPIIVDSMINVKKKSRRVSLCNNNGKPIKLNKLRRNSIDVISVAKTTATENNIVTVMQPLPSTATTSSSTTTISNQVSTAASRRHSSSHHHRKSSHDSVKLTKNSTNSNNQSSSDYNREGGGASGGGPGVRNSIGSSRESSASICTQKSRKVSITSQSGGKIPWCGCWGNGCF